VPARKYASPEEARAASNRRKRELRAARRLKGLPPPPRVNIRRPVRNKLLVQTQPSPAPEKKSSADIVSDIAMQLVRKEARRIEEQIARLRELRLKQNIGGTGPTSR
jgi:hypothetical protein